MALKLATVLFWLSGGVVGLHNVVISVPEVVVLGSTATLRCRWMLHPGESLYTVKWYHDAQEFFRFVPKEIPNTRVFSHTGFSVDLFRSGAEEVSVRVTSRTQSGRYRCEVSADAPSFHTTYKTKYIQVVEVPSSDPVVTASKSWVSVGDLIQANCSVPKVDPPANLTWILNGKQVDWQSDVKLTTEKPFSWHYTPDDPKYDNHLIFSPWGDRSEYENPVTVGNIPEDIQESFIGDDTKDTTLFIRAESLSRNRKENTNEDEIMSPDGENSNKSSSVSRLVIRIQSTHFHKSSINLTCVASVLSAWSASATLMLHEEGPQIAHVVRGMETSGTHDNLQTTYVFVTLGLVISFTWTYWLRRRTV